MLRQSSAQVPDAVRPESHGDFTPNTNAGTGLTRKDDGLFYQGHHLQYRVTGLQSFNLDRLRITLKASKTGNCLFHIDTLDLYYAKARQTYCEDCIRLFQLKDVDLQPEINGLIALLEVERVRMQGEKDKGALRRRPEMTEADKQEALEALKDKNLLQNILKDFESLGIVGENNNKLIGYIATISRLLADPFGVLILSRSGAGKTFLQDAVCKFIPEENVIQYTRLTGQALFYRDKDALKNKVLAIEEEEGMMQAIYSIRTLLSAQKLSIASTRTDAKTGKLCVDEYTVYGPTVVMLSTTNPECLDPETKQRFLILTIDESREQTQNILKIQRLKNTVTWHKTTVDDSTITKLHHNMQRLLKPLKPIFPDNLKVEFPPYCLQSRREQQKYLSFIKSIMLLHQYQRKQGSMKRMDGNTHECVVVTKEDVDTALHLGKEIFIRNVDDVSPTGRSLLTGIIGYLIGQSEHIKKVQPDNKPDVYEIPFTRKQLRHHLGWSEAHIRRNIEHLVDLGYVGIVNGAKGATFRYILLDDGLNDPKLEL
jgi:hypothetical protein